MRRALSASQLRPGIVSGLSCENIDRLVERTRCSTSNNALARDFIGIIDDRSLSFDQARATAVKFKKLIGPVSPSVRNAEVFAFEDILEQAPTDIVGHIGRIVSTDYRSLVKGVDFDFIDGRSLLFNAEHPFSVFGREIAEVKVKGAKFNSGEEMQPYKQLAPILAEFGTDGKITRQQQIDHKPTDAMEAPLAEREFELMTKAFRRNVGVVMPFCHCIFPSTSYAGQPLGSVMHFREAGLRDVRTHFSEMIGDWKIMHQSFSIRLDIDKTKHRHDQ